MRIFSVDDLIQQWPDLPEPEAFRKIQFEAQRGAFELTGRRNGQTREVISAIDFIDLCLCRHLQSIIAAPTKNGMPDPTLFESKKIFVEVTPSGRIRLPVFTVPIVSTALDGKRPPNAWPVVWTEIRVRIQDARDTPPVKTTRNTWQNQEAKKVLDAVFSQGIPNETDVNNSELYLKVIETAAFKKSRLGTSSGDFRKTILRAAGRVK